MTKPSSLRDLLNVLEDLYPPHTAEPWDSVGLICGDPQQPVKKVMFALDVVSQTVAEAIEWGADLLITHHPLFLRPVHSVAADTWKGSLVHQLIKADCALFNAHTNADIARAGVNEALASGIGLINPSPLITKAAANEGEPVHGDAQNVGLGRVGDLPQPVTFAELGKLVAQNLPAVAQGVRLAGDLTATVQRIAVVGGSGDSTFEHVRASGADVIITSDLRHHPVSELREQAIFEAQVTAQTTEQAPLARPFVIDVAHYASESPWLAHAAANLDQMYLNQAGISYRVSTVNTDPWDAHLTPSIHTTIKPTPSE